MGTKVLSDADLIKGVLRRGDTGRRSPADSRSPDGRAAGSAEMTLRPAQDRDPIAAGTNDIAVRRLFFAGLALEAVAGLIGDHRAAGKVQEAISELDLAIRDLRDMVFDHYRPDLPAAGRPGLERSGP